MNEHETRTRANAAGVELRAHGQALADMRADLITEWAATEREEADKRERLWQAVKTLDVVSEAMRSAISGGSVLDHRQAVRDILRSA